MVCVVFFSDAGDQWCTGNKKIPCGVGVFSALLVLVSQIEVVVDDVDYCCGWSCYLLFMYLVYLPVKYISRLAMVQSNAKENVH